MPDHPIRLFAALKEHDVPFVVIGGHAVSAHGFISMTEAHDIVFLRTPDSETRLFNALTGMHARWISNERDPKTGFEYQIPVTLEYVRGTRMMLLITDHGFLDIFDAIPGHLEAPVASLMDSAMDVDGIRFASKDWLLKMKKAAGRPKDLIDLENLRELPD
jgi:hypothetical protein